MLAPRRIWKIGREQRGLERGRDVDLQRPQRDARQVELGRDHFPLFGHAQRTVHRARRLRLDGQMCRATAAPHRAAPAVEQCQVDVLLPARSDDRFLRLVQLPGCGESTAVLGRIRVAEHHLLPSVDRIAIARDGEQLAQRGAGVAQVVDRLEQRHDAEWRLQPGGDLQRVNGQDVRWAFGHRDHVGAERPWRDRRSRAERLEHVAHVRLESVCQFERPGDRSAAYRDLLAQEPLSVFLVPGGVCAESLLLGDGVERLGVSRRFLAQVEPHEGETETREPALDIEQSAVGQDTGTRVLERPPAQLERLGKVLDAPAHPLGRRAVRHLPLQHQFDSGARRAQPGAEVTEQGAVRFSGVADPRPQLRARVAERKLRSECPQLSEVQVRRHPTGQQRSLYGDLRRHVRVAVAIAAHPRAEADRRRIPRQVLADRLVQGAVQRPEIGGHRVPERLLEHHEPPPHFVQRCRLGVVHFVSFPRDRDFAKQRLADVLALGRGEVTTVLLPEEIRDAPM